MELRDIVAMIRSSAIAVVILAALGAISGAVGTIVATPTYRATNTVMVSVVAGADVNDLNLGANFVARQVPTYAVLARSPRVLDPVIRSLGISTTTQQLHNQVTTSVQTNTALIDITVTGSDAGLTAATADAVATQLSTAVKQTAPVQANGGSSVSVMSISPATTPTVPFAPSLTTNVGVGLAAGLLLGFGWAVLRRSLDTKVRSGADVRSLIPAPLLGTISDDTHGKRGRSRSVVASPLSVRAEEFRQLRTNLQFVDAASRPQSFVVTSTRNGEGKSSTAIDLAFVLAEAGSSVCLVDADLRRPSIANALELEGSGGLTSVLIGQATTDDVLQTVNGAALKVITSGLLPPNPSELLGSKAMADFIADLESRFTTVIIDSAPLLPVTDAAILGKVTGGALLVVGSATVTRDQLEDSLAKLKTIDSRLLGVVLNKVNRRRSGASAYRYDADTQRVPGSAPTTPDHTRHDSVRPSRPAEPDWSGTRS